MARSARWGVRSGLAAALASVSVLTLTAPTSALGNPPSSSAWGAAQPVLGLSALNKGLANFDTVSCPSPGNCTAAGSYWTSSDPSPESTEGFVVDESNGTWGVAREVPGLRKLNADRAAQVVSVSCATPGNCAAGGRYGGAGDQQAFLVEELNGVWSLAHAIPGLAELNGGAQASIDAVSCPTVGACTAVGYYTDSIGTEIGRAHV